MEYMQKVIDGEIHLENAEINSPLQDAQQLNLNYLFNQGIQNEVLFAPQEQGNQRNIRPDHHEGQSAPMNFPINQQGQGVIQEIQLSNLGQSFPPINPMNPLGQAHLNNLGQNVPLVPVPLNIPLNQQLDYIRMQRLNDHHEGQSAPMNFPINQQGQGIIQEIQLGNRGQDLPTAIPKNPLGQIHPSNLAQNVPLVPVPLNIPLNQQLDYLRIQRLVDLQRSLVENVLRELITLEIMKRRVGKLHKSIAYKEDLINNINDQYQNVIE
ncbi:hypothetical protein H8356DRAFT_1661721 [Neocallimastix lanati (nom. inval.)]|jgi:hypothetical protein|uniref:Uncharacterized protein n=1 Tax=Neocallimastix californiae TaxID=1754190 RepID=A0A1Y1YSD7_9FUNG|nr:hypothetical protein H8356DRAFT_1745687 [Neocallimastix sp. JGI-2020a]KAG4100491.1 hypothetical protein H8356DRAFT_1661721 [Neocallimastix sp. JGI-2020a]ORY00943.1 hypothetical protein LY90DRAFT_225132 [Neocallimastix californiae]|eukprot:ORY00943.1 hypothetical protein LY90DRAFT_225132 [Neocallimastix californiae]